MKSGPGQGYEEGVEDEEEEEDDDDESTVCDEDEENSIGQFYINLHTTLLWLTTKLRHF